MRALCRGGLWSCIRLSRKSLSDYQGLRAQERRQRGQLLGVWLCCKFCLWLLEASNQFQSSLLEDVSLTTQWCMWATWAPSPLQGDSGAPSLWEGIGILQGSPGNSNRQPELNSCNPSCFHGVGPNQHIGGSTGNLLEMQITRPNSDYWVRNPTGGPLTI